MLVLVAPLAAQEISAPEPRWPVVSSAPATMADAAEPPDFDTATGDTAPAARPGALADPTTQPITQPRVEGAEPAEQRGHNFIACEPGLTVVNNRPDLPPLSPHEKFSIFYKQLYNPCRYVGAAFAAGISQAQDGLPGYGQGMEGYGKRVGANVADTALATFFGRSLLPTLLHDDPRYFRLGRTAGFKQRLMHAVLSPEWTRRDNGTHRFNYSRVLGDFMATGIGNAYYPESDRGAGPTFSRGFTMLGIASGTAAFQEFWPDIKAKFFRKHKSERADMEPPAK